MRSLELLKSEVPVLIEEHRRRRQRRRTPLRRPGAAVGRDRRAGHRVRASASASTRATRARRRRGPVRRRRALRDRRADRPAARERLARPGRDGRQPRQLSLRARSGPDAGGDDSRGRAAGDRRDAGRPRRHARRHRVRRGARGLAPEPPRQRAARRRVVIDRSRIVGRGVGFEVERVVQGVDREHVAVRVVALGRAGTGPFRLAVMFSVCTAPAGTFPAPNEAASSRCPRPTSARSRRRPGRPRSGPARPCPRAGQRSRAAARRSLPSR